MQSLAGLVLHAPASLLPEHGSGMKRECKGSVPGLASLPWLQAWKKAHNCTLERRQGEGVLYCWDPGGGLEHHHSGLEHHGILAELGLNPFCVRFSCLRTENSWAYLFVREGIQ